jgi:hypothetical protein
MIPHRFFMSVGMAMSLTRLKKGIALCNQDRGRLVHLTCRRQRWLGQITSGEHRQCQRQQECPAKRKGTGKATFESQREKSLGYSNVLVFREIMLLSFVLNAFSCFCKKSLHKFYSSSSSWNPIPKIQARWLNLNKEPTKTISGINFLPLVKKRL